MSKRGPVAAILLAAQRSANGVECVADSDTIEAAISVFEQAEVDELVVVLGERAGTLAFQIAAPVTTVRRDADWTGGWARGIASGLQALQPDATAIVLATVDVAPEDARALRRTQRRFHRGEAAIFAFERDGAPALPVLVDRRYRSVLIEITDGDDPAERVAAHPDGCVLVASAGSTPTPATD